MSFAPMANLFRNKPSRITSIQKTLLALFFLSLPVTSFPYLPSALGGSAQVRPLAIYPLILLLVVLTVPRLLTRKLPKPLVALLAFALVAVVSSALGLLQGVDEFRGVSVLDRTIRSLLTLGLGLAVYATVSLAAGTPEDLRFMLRLLYIGMGIALLWGTLQAVYVIRFDPVYFDWMREAQKLISIRRLFDKRVSGMAFEPNWFAEQIGFLLLPWLFAAVTTNQTVFPWRYHRLTVEAVLLLWSVGILIFTFSRAGLVVMILILALSALLYRPKKEPNEQPRTSFSWRALLKRAVLAVGIIAVLAVLIFAAGTRNNYFARLWTYWTDEEATGEFLTYIAFSQRFIYWDAGLKIYEDHPIFGVGLGNFAFYFDESLPDIPLFRHPEILRLITPKQGRNVLITPKSLFVRLLAETGLVGVSAFLAFVIGIFGFGVFLWLAPKPEHKFWGKGGLLGLVSFALFSFSTDSFAIPNMWVTFGLITAAGYVFASPQDQTQRTLERENLSSAETLPG